ncbi:MAG: hypothetical protein RLY14_1606 [Planctomycetota bacterium]|jgi:negative regulator of sigma E activity
MTPAEEQLSAYLDGELDAIERAQVESLLQRDSELRKTLEKLRAVRSWMAELSRPTSVTSKPIAELLAESSNPISPSLNVQGDGLQQGSWFTSDWRWPAGLVTAAAIMLSILAMWPTGESFNVAYSTNSQSEDRLATPKPAERANSFKTDAIADASQAIDALPTDALLAHRQQAEDMTANAAVLELAAQDATASKDTPAANKSELLMAKGLGGDLPAEAEMAGDLELQANALAANGLPAEALGRQAGTAGIANAGEMQAKVASRGSAGGQGGLGGVAMGSPLPDAPAAKSRVPNSRAPGAAAAGTADSTEAPGLAATASSPAPGKGAPPSDAKGDLGFLEETSSKKKSMDSNRFADTGAKPGDKIRPESQVESLGGLGGGGLGGNAGTMVDPSNRTLSSASEERQEKTGQAVRSGFSRIYLESLGERSPKNKGFQDSQLLEVSSKRFEDLLRELGERVAPESIKVYRIPATNWEVFSSWKEERKGYIEELVLQNPAVSTRERAEGNTRPNSVDRNSKNQSTDVFEDQGETWILLKVTPESWSELAVKLQQTGIALREIDPSSADLPKGLSLTQIKGESTEQSEEKDQRILILVNLQ